MFALTGDDWQVIIIEVTTGITTIIAALVAAYNSVRANKQSGATHEIVSGTNDKVQ